MAVLDGLPYSPPSTSHHGFKQFLLLYYYEAHRTLVITSLISPANSAS